MAEELVLRLHLREGTRQSTDDCLVGNLVDINADHDAKIEHELIPLVFFVLDADWVSKEAVFIVGVADRDIPIAKSLSRDDILGHCLEVKQSRLIDSRLGDNASWWALVDNFGSCGVSDQYPQD